MDTNTTIKLGDAVKAGETVINAIPELEKFADQGKTELTEKVEIEKKTAKKLARRKTGKRVLAVLGGVAFVGMVIWGFCSEHVTPSEAQIREWSA